MIGGLRQRLAAGLDARRKQPDADAFEEQAPALRVVDRAHIHAHHALRFPCLDRAFRIGIDAKARGNVVRGP